MRRIFYFTTLAVVLVFFTVSCKKMDSKYKDFVVPGGMVYPGKASNPLVYVGRSRVKISWLRGTDPTVTKARIFWDNFTDSVEINIPKTGDTISTTIDNLPEKSYTFIIKTYNTEGRSSVPVELLSATYGDQYQASLLSRPVSSAILTESGDITIEWGAADLSNGAFLSEVDYTDRDGNELVKLFNIEEESSLIPAVKPGTTIKYRTLFIPDSLSIDTFYTPYETARDLKIDKASWTVVDFSSQHPGEANSPANLFDGTYHTRWHTFYPSSEYPHWVIIDMGIARTITKFSAERTDKDTPGGDDRAPDQFKLLQSDDLITWTEVGTFDFNREENGEQIFTIASPVSARYFEFMALSGPVNYMTLGEVSVYGY